MANRERKNELKIYLSNKEQYILEQKVKISGMKGKSTFLRRLILYGFVYGIDYSPPKRPNHQLCWWNGKAPLGQNLCVSA